MSDAPEKPPPPQMKAVVLQGFGGTKMLKVQKQQIPVVAAGQLLIRVKAW